MPDGAGQTVREARGLMCSPGGRDYMEREVLRPFGYSLDPGPIGRENDEMRDARSRALLALGEIDMGESSRDQILEAVMWAISELNAPVFLASHASRERQQP